MPAGHLVGQEGPRLPALPRLHLLRGQGLVLHALPGRLHLGSGSGELQTLPQAGRCAAGQALPPVHQVAGALSETGALAGMYTTLPAPLRSAFVTEEMSPGTGALFSIEWQMDRARSPGAKENP